MDCTEEGALGVAMTAGVGAGLFSSFNGATKQMVRIKERFYPRPELADIYNHKYKRYCQSINVLNSFWNI